MIFKKGKPELLPTQRCASDCFTAKPHTDIERKYKIIILRLRSNTQAVKEAFFLFNFLHVYTYGIYLISAMEALSSESRPAIAF